MIQFAAQYPWLIPLLPLLTCALIGLIGYKIKPYAHIPAILSVFFSFVLSIALLIGLSNGSLKAENLHDLPVFDWFTAGNFHVAAAVSIDQLTALYLSFITGIGLLIFIYAAGYMHGDYGYFRFFAFMSIFVFFMTTLVMASNFVALFLGWEGVGLASYLLIGYYYPRPSAVAAAKKAFITNRVGDLGLLIGIFLLYRYFGTLEFSAIFAQLHDSQKIANLMPIIRFIPFCIMLGAFGKSAQFPLHVWLPDAMEGPTPVSALIHAATMVTAGIYLIARTMPLFAMGPGNYFDINILHFSFHLTALDVVACIGCFTAFLAASIALCQYDLKRIWAYSTLSQLGYMFLGLGVMASSSAVFHVFTHAFFKALLFLSAGSVMHAMGGELDIRKMSGLRKVMPITAFTMLVGCIALAGVPGFAGFFSKDEIISHAINAPTGPGFFLGLVALLVAFMTAFYTFRVYFKVFLGPLQLPATAGHHEESPFLPDTGPGIIHESHEDAPHGHDPAAAAHTAPHVHDEDAHAPNDGSPLMWVPLLILSIGAIGAGYLGFSKTGDWLHPFLGAALVPTPEAAERVSEHLLLALGILIPPAGILVAWYFYKANRPAADAMAARFRPLVNFLYNKWFFDEIYAAFILNPIWMLAVVFSIFDRYIIDGIVFFIAFVPQIVGYSLKPMQRGVLQRYAVGMIAGLAAIILGVMYLLHT
ncbi:MAG TPA: NADH-quinone oxidoreductase subunit L [Phycisphaerae bacterium]|nr:NADH-quinone oxidoreductase subunit L [Phycisphaerae bacterium]